MANVITSPADVVNLALAVIGRRDRIGNIYEGSAAARAALDIYSQARDEMLRAGNWGFAEKIAAAVVSGTAAPFPWTVSYVYPTDCIRVRNMFAATYQADQNNPVPILYQIADAASGKVILCKTAAATLVYTEQVTDPTKWDALFIAAFADDLGRRMAPAMASAEAAKQPAESLKGSFPMAKDTLG